MKYQLPLELTGLGDLNGDLWSFALVPGWRELHAAPLEAICARQYVACNEAVLDARAGMHPARWLDVSYEDLAHAPAAEVEQLYAALGLRFTDGARAHAARLATTAAATALTAPREGKWREQNAEAVTRILPLVADVERRLGYRA